MIRSKADYRAYVEADCRAMKRVGRPRFFGDEVWKFLKVLRALEYYTNCKRSYVSRMWRAALQYRFHALSLKCGFCIPINVFGPGLAIPHRGTIVVNTRATVGAWCRLHTCVNIGATGGCVDAVPTIGDNVYIGPGAKLFGRIVIADGITIGANSVVNRSFTDPGITIAGVPARRIDGKPNAKAPSRLAPDIPETGPGPSPGFLRELKR